MNFKQQAVNHYMGERVDLTKSLLEPQKVNDIVYLLQNKKLMTSDLSDVHMVSKLL